MNKLVIFILAAILTAIFAFSPLSLFIYDRCETSENGFEGHRFLDNPWYSACNGRVYALKFARVHEGGKNAFIRIEGEVPQRFKGLDGRFAIGEKGLYYLSIDDLFPSCVYLVPGITIKDIGTVDDDTIEVRGQNYSIYSGNFSPVLGEKAFNEQLVVCG